MKAKIMIGVLLMVLGTALGVARQFGGDPTPLVCLEGPAYRENKCGLALWAAERKLVLREDDFRLESVLKPLPAAGDAL